MKKLTSDSIGARALTWLARVVFKYRWWWVWPQILLFGGCVWYTWTFLKFDMSRDNLVGGHRSYHSNYLNFKKEFPLQADLVVVAESEEHEKNRQFVERLGVKLEAETNLFRDVFYKGDLKMLGPKALLFLSETNLLDLKQALQDFRPFIDKFTRATNLVTFVDTINAQFYRARRETNAQTTSLIKALPVLERILTQASASLHRPGVPPSPGVTALFDAGPEAESRQYITFADARMYLVTTRAPNEKLNAAAIDRLRVLVDETQKEVPGVNVGVTGAPVLEYDEMNAAQKDSMIASIVSLILCALIFIYGYQETGRPVKATICLIIGLGYTMAFTTAVIGHLNVLTLMFVPMLIGLAIDFGVHLVTRYEEELRHGKTEQEALAIAMVFTGQGIFTGAFTTAGAFLAMAITDFKGIQEMGIISGGGLLICLIPMLTMLPVLLLRGRQNVIDHRVGQQLNKRARIENIWLQRPVTVTVVVAVLSILAMWPFFKVKFDYNLLHMQSDGLASVEYEKKLIFATNSSRSVLFGAVIANTLEDAVRFEKQIRELPTNVVASVDSITQFLNEDQTGKIPLIGEIKQTAVEFCFAPPDPAPVNIPELSRSLYSLSGYLGMALEVVEKEKPELVPQMVSLRLAIENLRKDMLRGAESALPERAEKLGYFQRALFDDIRSTFAALREQDNEAPLRKEDLPPALSDRFVGVTGKFLLQVYPRKDVWQRETQQEFLAALRSTLDPKDTNYPNITGAPVQLYEYTTLLKESYQEAALYSLAAIVVLVLIHFRSLTSVVLALLPVGIGTLWMGGMMGLTDIPFNPANIMTLPLVIGIGVTNGIHILNRFAEERHPSILAKSTGKAVFVSGLTAIAGFGSLIIAEHHGVRSLGYVMATGIATCMIAGLTCVPALLNLWLRGRGEYKKPSADNAQSTLGQEEPR